MTQLIQWFPGHMAKAKRVLQEHLKVVDIVLELRDARIPESSSNPDLDKLVKDKSRIIILNKRDLANPKVTREWIEHFSTKAPTFAVNTVNGDGMHDVLETLRAKAEEINERLKRRGRNPRNIRLLIIGIPNVGKSALINRLANRAKAKVENRPGVTRGKQWIKVREGLQLMDSPGILWPKFEDQEVGLKLAATGAIRSELINEEEIAFHLLKWLLEIAPEELTSFFKIDLMQDPYDLLLAIGKKRGFLQAGGKIRTEQTARMILKEFRDGRIGQITLERPGKEDKNESMTEQHIEEIFSESLQNAEDDELASECPVPLEDDVFLTKTVENFELISPVFNDDEIEKTVDFELQTELDI